MRQLQAQRNSLEKHREDVLKLRDPGKLSGEEAHKVEQKLLEFELEVQTLGVQLGDLLGNEPSPNLFLTLQARAPESWHDPGLALPRRLWSGLAWAVQWWALAAVGTGLVLESIASVRVLRRAR
jgi:hypothetical protein